ncbi:MAG TPA: hypothetical protein VFB96_04790 [Pirellulaceae bacterium]|nr:hypothetical protein [Pirellulaceae bacterium]
MTHVAISSNSNIQIRRHWLILAGFGAVHFAVLFAGPLVTDEAGLIPTNNLVVALLGGLFAPHWLLGAVSIVGVWVVLGGGRWCVRLGAGVLGWVWLGMALVLGELLTPNWPYDLPKWLLAAGLAALVSILVSAVAYRVLGWRLALDGATPPVAAGQPFQFRLIQLVVAVTLIAATLGVARLLNQRFVHLALSNFFIPTYVLDWLWRVAVEVWFPSVIAVATVVLMLRKDQRWLWIFPLFLVLLALDAAAQFGEFAYRNRVGLGYLGEVYPLLLRERFVADGAIMLSLLLSSMVLRTLGYRLGPASVPPRDGATA